MKNMSRISRLQSDTLYATLSNGLDNTIVVLMVAIGRFLGEEEFGKLSYVQSLAMVFLSLGNFGLTAIIMRDVSPDSSKAPLYLRSVVPWIALLSLTAILLLTSYLYLSGTQNRHLIWIGLAMGFATAFRYMIVTLRGFFQALGRFDTEFRCVLIGNALLIPLCLLLLFLGYGLLEVTLGIMFSRVFEFIIQSIGLSRTIGEKAWHWKPDWATALRLQKAAMPIGTGIAVAVLSLNVDTILLTYLTDFVQVGLYNASFKVFFGLLIIPTVATAILLPRIARAVSTDDALKEFWIGSGFLLLIATGLVAILGAFSTEIIVVIFGSSFSAAGDLFFWHLVTCIPAFQVMMARIYLIAVSKSQAFLILSFLGLIIRVALLCLVIPRFGLVAAVQAVFAAEMITYLITLTFLLSTRRRPAMVAGDL